MTSISQIIAKFAAHKIYIPLKRTDMKRIISSLLLLLLAATTAFAQEERAQVTFKTNKGKIVVELYNETPRHRDNFLYQVKHKTYNGVLFHRVINEFMIQGGDPNSKKTLLGKKLGIELGEGTDKPSDWIDPEFRVPEYFHVRGSLAAAREGDSVNPQKKSSSQQFYIVTGRTFTDADLNKTQVRITNDTKGKVTLTPEMREVYRTVGGAPHLDGSYTVFGRVIQGMEIVDAIQKVETDTNNRPLKDIRIKKAKITKKLPKK